MYFTQPLQQIIHMEFYIECYVFTSWHPETELQKISQ